MTIILFELKHNPTHTVVKIAATGLLHALKHLGWRMTDVTIISERETLAAILDYHHAPTVMDLFRASPNIGNGSRHLNS